MSIPISTGSGAASVAAELLSTLQYQQIKVLGGETGSTSVMGVNPDRSINVSVIGTVQMSGSVVAAGNQSVSGALNVSGSVLLGSSNASVIAVLQNSSLITIASGSVLSVPTGSMITVWQNSSVLAVPVGSTIAVLQSSSIIARVTGSVVALPASGSVLSNSTITSVATANGGLPVYAQLTRYVLGTADMRVVLGNSVVALGAPGAGIRNYVTNVQVANFGSASVLVKISDIHTSTLGWTIAPAGGGSNFNPFYRGADNSPITASLNGTASVLVSMQGFTSNI